MRICVELDITKPMISKFRIQKRTYRVEYERLHLICFNCGCYGHGSGNCTFTNSDPTSSSIASTKNNGTPTVAEQPPDTEDRSKKEIQPKEEIGEN